MAASIAINVLFPLPFGPSRPNTPPPGTSSAKPLSAVRSPYCRVMFEARMANAGIAASVTRGRRAIERLGFDRQSRDHELQPEEHKDCDQRAHIQHPRLRHELPDRVD